MHDHPRRVLLLYSDSYYLVKQVYPFGLDLIANHLRASGHEAVIDYPLLPHRDLDTNLRRTLSAFDPHVVGIGIRNLDTCMSGEEYGDYHGTGCRTFWFLPQIRKIVDRVRALRPDIPIVAGGGAFTVSPAAILQYLGLRYGIVGEGEEPLRRFVEAFPDRARIADIPGLAVLDGKCRIHPRASYRFAPSKNGIARDRKFEYAFETAGMPVQVKRGCNRRCSYCVEPLIEGRRFAFRDMDEVAAELKAVSNGHTGVKHIFFVDTEFNVPDMTYGSALVNRIVDEGLHRRFRYTSQFVPEPFDAEFAGALSRAGFSVILTCDSFSDEVLEKNGAGYREKDILRALKLCEDQGIDCTVAMIFGLPGETYKTIDHSMDRMRQHPCTFLRRYEYTFGGRIYNGTRLSRWVQEDLAEEANLYGSRSAGHLEPWYYCAPQSPMELKDYVERGLGYSVPYENRYDENRRGALGLAYLTDQERWNEAVPLFTESPVPVQSQAYDYLFRKLSETGRTKEAKKVSESLLKGIAASDAPYLYAEQEGMVRFYLSLLG